MYENAGRSIKSVVTVAVIVMMVLSVIGGIIVMAEGGVGVILGLIVMALGCFSAWLSGLLLYAYGEITDRLISIDENLEAINYRQSVAAPTTASVNRPTPSASSYHAPSAAQSYNTIPAWKRVQLEQEAKARSKSNTYCAVCGHDNTPGTRFCVKCGHQLNT